MRNPSMRWFVALVPLVLSSGCASQASRTLAPYKQTAKQADSAAAWYEYGAAAIAVEKYSTARKALARSLEIDPDNLDAHMKMAQAYGGLGQVMDMTDCYREVIKRDSEHREALVALGETDISQILTFESAGAISLFTTGPGINILQAAFLSGWDMSLNDMVEVYVECLDIWKKMVKVEEKNAHFWVNLGVIANLTNNMEGSLVSFDTALRYDPKILEERDLLKEIYDASARGEKWVPDIPPS